MVQFYDTPLDAVAGIADGSTVMIGGFGAAGQPVDADQRADRVRRPRPHGRQQQRRQRRPRPGRADPRGPGTQDHLLVPAPDRLLVLRREVPRRRDRAGARAAGQPGRADPCRRRRDRRLLHPDRLRHAAGRGQGGPGDRRPALRPGVPDPRRRRSDPRARRRPARQPRLPQDRAQLRPDHGRRSDDDDRRGDVGRPGRRHRPRERRDPVPVCRPGRPVDPAAAEASA